MDRAFAAVNAALDALRAHVAAVQRAHFTGQMASAARLQRSQSVLAGLILLMGGGAAAYVQGLTPLAINGRSSGA